MDILRTRGEFQALAEGKKTDPYSINKNLGFRAQALQKGKPFAFILTCQWKSIREMEKIKSLLVQMFFISTLEQNEKTKES